MKENIFLSDVIFNGLRPDGIALVDGCTGEELSYNEMIDHVKRFGAGLLKLGVKPGDVVAVICENSPRQVVALLAIFYISAVPALVNPIFTEYELSNILELVKPLHVVLHNDVLVKLSSSPFFHQIENIILIPRSCCSQSSNDSRITQYCDLLSSTPLNAPIYLKGDPREEMALLMFSSGTTGTSKGVKLSHHNLIFMTTTLARNLPENHSQLQQVFLVFIPFFHIFGLVLSLFVPLQISSKIIIFPRFNSEKVFEAVQKHQVTHMSLVPSMIQWMINNQKFLEKYRLSSLNTIYAGGSFLPVKSEIEFKKIYNIENLLQGYGMTEVSLAVLFNFPKIGVKNGSLGKALEQTHVIIKCQKTGDILAANKIGEICVKGPQVMLGYLGNPAASRLMYDEEGWFHTGDIAYYDKDGFFFYVDRVKDLIKYQSFQVSPSEIESLISKHPAVSEVVVIGISNQEHGELPKALIIKKEEADVTEEDIINLVKSKLSGYKHLRGGVEFVDMLPKNSSGKVLRAVLKQQHNENVSKLKSRL